MKSDFSKKLLAVFSGIIATFGIVLACADGDWRYYIYGNSNFTPEAFVSESYKPLFYDPMNAFYDIGSDTQHESRFNDEVVEDWSKYVYNKMTKQDIAAILFNDSLSAEVAALNEYAVKNVKNEAYNKWSNKADLFNSHVKRFIEFAYQARNLDKIIANSRAETTWDYKYVSTRNQLVPNAVVTEFARKYNTIDDQFLKNRYWFQTIKAYFYSNSFPQCEGFFDKTQKNVPQNTLYYRALSYLAGMYYRNKDYAQANYLYSIVFDKAPQLRTVTVSSFHPQSEAEWEQSLKFAKNDKEKAAMWALLGYYADEKRAINEIYKLYPQSLHMDYLLTRLINKEENRLYNPNFKSAWQYKKGLADSLNKESFQLVYKIASEQKTAQPYLWNMAAGYLNTLAGKFDVAVKYYEKAEKRMPTSKMAVDQLRLLRFVNTLSSMYEIKEEKEKILYPDLKWLYFELPQNNPHTYFRYTYASEWSKKYIAYLYKNAKNQVYSELFQPTDNFYSTAPNLDGMKAFLSKSNKTPYEQLMQDIYPNSVYDINHYQAVMATLQDKTDDAIAFMQKSDKLQSTELLGDPFIGNIQDCHDCDHAQQQKVKYTNLSLLKKIKEIKDKINRNIDLYNNYILLGNAYYNLSFYGNARVFSTSRLMGDIPGSSFDIPRFSQKMLTDCSLAKYYYNKAGDIAQNDEEKAKAAYMLAKCERNDFYNKQYNFDLYNASKYYNYYNATNSQQIDFLEWDGFRTLKTQYSHTKFYQEVINECGYFKKYVYNN